MKNYSTIGIKKPSNKIKSDRSLYRLMQTNRELQSQLLKRDEEMQELESRLFEITVRVAQAELRAGRADMRAQNADMRATVAQRETSQASSSAAKASLSADESLEIVTRFEKRAGLLEHRSGLLEHRAGVLEGKTDALQIDAKHIPNINHRLILLENNWHKISRVVKIFLKPIQLIAKPFRSSNQENITTSTETKK